MVRENGEPQQVTTFAEGEFPLAAAIALDRSFSMARICSQSRNPRRACSSASCGPADESMIIGDWFAGGSRRAPIDRPALRSTRR